MYECVWLVGGSGVLLWLQCVLHEPQQSVRFYAAFLLSKQHIMTHGEQQQEEEEEKGETKREREASVKLFLHIHS